MVNPHAARNEEVIKLLETKPQPMPAYMINTFLGIFEVQTQKDLLEAKMGIEQNAVNQNARMLITHWYADTTGNDLDSIPALLTTINTPYADLYKAAFYRGMHNPNAAQIVLDSITDKYELTESELTLYNGVTNFYAVQTTLTSEGDSAAFNLNEGAKNTLLTIANDSLTKAGRYAKAWLKFTANELYWPYLPTTQEAGNKKEKRNVFEKREVEKSALVNVYPNPAKGYFTISLNYQEANTNAVLTLINGMGQVVLTRQINSNGSNTIPTNNLPTGVYILVATIKTQEIHKQTIEIIH